MDTLVLTYQQCSPVRLDSTNQTQLLIGLQKPRLLPLNVRRGRLDIFFGHGG
jgi:hypothetical protein